MTISPKVKIIIICATFVVLVCIGSIGMYLNIGRIGLPRWSSGKAGRINVSPTPSPVPTPTPLPIAPGRQVYNIQSDSKTPGPAVSEASFDPLDVAKGGTITVTVKAKDASSVKVIMIDDSGKSDHVLTFSSGVWTGSWTVPATHNRIYAATIEAVNTASEKRSIELWFR